MWKESSRVAFVVQGTDVLSRCPSIHLTLMSFQISHLARVFTNKPEHSILKVSMESHTIQN